MVYVEDVGKFFFDQFGVWCEVVFYDGFDDVFIDGIIGQWMYVEGLVGQGVGVWMFVFVGFFVGVVGGSWVYGFL